MRVIFLYVFILVSAGSFAQLSKKKDAALKDSAQSEWLRALLSAGRLLSPCKPYSINIQTDTIAKDEMLKFELRGGQSWKDVTGTSTFRSEIDTKDKPAMRSVKW